MDLEIKIEQGDFTMTDVDSLVYLYSQGIEFYEDIDSNKHKIFYKRTQRLMNKPSVFQAMKSPIKKKAKEEPEVSDYGLEKMPAMREKSRSIAMKQSF